MPRLSKGKRPVRGGAAGFSAIPVWQPVVAVTGRDWGYDGMGSRLENLTLGVVTVAICTISKVDRDATKLEANVGDTGDAGDVDGAAEGAAADGPTVTSCYASDFHLII